jgi:hypothetical protein
MKTLTMHFDAQTLNVASGEVTFDRNYSSALNGKSLVLLPSNPFERVMKY